MSASLGEQILEAAGKLASQAEVTGISREYLSVEMTPVRCVFGSGRSSGHGLRMVRNGRLGTAGQWGPIDSFELVDRTISSCRYGPEALIDFPSTCEAPSGLENEAWDRITHENAMEYLDGIRDRITAEFPEAVLSSELKWGMDRITLINSRGLGAAYAKGSITGNFSVTMPSPDGLLQTGCMIRTSKGLPKPGQVVDTLSLPLTMARLQPGEAVGRKKVVLSPAAFSVMLQGIRAGVSGRLLARGASPLAGMEGRRVLSDKLTVKDMPRLPGGAASAPFDSEGVPTRDKVLFLNGEFRDFIHDLSSAAATGGESTGSSGRNLGEHSRPVCTNLVVEACPDSSVNTLEETCTGILVNEILSAESGDAASGHFVFDCGRVHLFRGGEIHGYCDGCVLTGNVYDALSRVTAVGGKQFSTDCDILPFISLDGISVR